jgi:ribosomal protein S18 acetylase RimI-like enzyme
MSVVEDSRYTRRAMNGANSIEQLEAAFREKGWPPALLQRAVELRFPKDVLLRWARESWANTEFVSRRLDWHDRLTRGDLRGREATLQDNEAFQELWANSPENLGEWEVTTERGPNAFAQFLLQEHVTVLVLEEQAQLIATCAFASRIANVGGLQLPVHYGQALRVHKDHRRRGYGDQVRSLEWPIGAARRTVAQFDYMRSQNFAVVNWWQKYSPGFFDDVPKRDGDVPGLSVTVLQYPAREFAGDRSGIRKAVHDDIPRCVALINRTHRGHDLFRTYTEEFLLERLADGYWGSHLDRWFGPDRHWSVYGLSDFYVVEEGGKVVACAGLWDRGRDIRDRWRHTRTGEEKVVEVTAVLDIGFARGHAQAMAKLLGFFVGETNRLGRDFLTVPLDRFPRVASLLGVYGPIPEVRALRWGMKEPPITRPHTDLVYW